MLDDHKQLTNQFGLKSPPTQLAESHTWNLNGSHLFERKQKGFSCPHHIKNPATVPTISILITHCDFQPYAKKIDDSL